MNVDLCSICGGTVLGGLCKNCTPSAIPGAGSGDHGCQGRGNGGRCRMPGTINTGGQWQCAWHVKAGDRGIKHDFYIWLCRKQIQIHKNRTRSPWLDKPGELWSAVQGYSANLYPVRLDSCAEADPAEIKRLSNALNSMTEGKNNGGEKETAETEVSGSGATAATG